MNILKAAIAGAAIALSLSAIAQEQTSSEHRLADHPAVTIKRLSAHQGYDYASPVYPRIPLGCICTLHRRTRRVAAQVKHRVAEADIEQEELSTLIHCER